VRIERVAKTTREIVDAVRRLVPQLSSSASVPDSRAIAEIVASASTSLFVARSDAGDIVGMLTLVVFHIPTGTRAWIEDVIVDGDARHGGAGTALVEEALRHAAASGARTVDLTSRPERRVANRLYERLGFERRETNAFRRVLGD